MHRLKWQSEREGRVGEERWVRMGGTEGDRGTARRTEERPNSLSLSLSKNLISPESPWRLGCQSRRVPPLWAARTLTIGSLR